MNLMEAAIAAKLGGGGGSGSVTPASIVTATGQMTAQQKSDTLDNIGGVARIIEITYADLKTLRDSGNLIPGQQYRIIDYVCTVANDSEARAISHPYDIIVTADSANTLNENARACLHSGDAYYSAQGAQADLSAWELKYCLDNDANRFAWADSTNGKGVVFWLKDDWNNECPYDFKQIQFKRYKITACPKSPDLVGTYLASAQVDGDITKNTADFIWAYTFTGTVDNTYVDASTFNQSFVIEDRETERYHCFDNCVTSYVAIGSSADGKACLNNIAIIAETIPPRSNTFGNNCRSNTFGNDCWDNTFGNDCGSNTFGNDCGSNTFGNDCGSNTFGNNCGSNTFGNDCRYNALGNDCRSNTFGNDCWDNTFGNDCGSNTFGNNCRYNALGGNCRYNTFGNHAQGNEASASCRWCTFEDGVKGVVLSNDAATNANQIQNYHVLNGTHGVMKTGLTIGNPVQTPITINASLGLSYCTFVGKNTSGTVKTWNPMDSAT